MAYSVDIIYSKNSDLSNSSVESESGQPSNVTLTSLDSNQRYYTKAVLKNNGATEDESSVETFQTIPAGVITLEHISTYRSEYSYDVTYRYTSTYAPSSAVLSTNGSSFQGYIDSQQNAVSFWVTGLTPGDAYLTNVTLTDIYGESATVTGSIVATVVNEIHITTASPSATTMEVGLTYVIDSGFYNGWVDWWYASQDPTQEPSQGHTYFNDGDETVTITGLDDDTSYKFRATITLSDRITMVDSNVVTESTLNDYSTEYFTIKNEYNGSNTIKMTASNASHLCTVFVSTDDGTTWTQKTSSTEDTTLGTIGTGGRMMIKSQTPYTNTGYNISGQGYYNYIWSTRNISVYGNIASLTHGDNFNTSRMLVNSFALSYLFLNCTTLVSAENLYFGSYSRLGGYCFEQMFYGCSSLVTAPKELAHSDELSEGCYQQMFYNCVSLVTTPQLPHTTVDISCYNSMFYNCSSLVTTPSLPATTLNQYCYSQMFRNCTSLVNVQATLPATTLYRGCYEQMFCGCSSLTTAPTVQATTVAQNCCTDMFNGCGSITTVQATLPATTLASQCYRSMFQGCGLITTAPSLPATTLADNCYKNMFYGCRSLATAPSLPATTLSPACYQEMFRDCTSLTTMPNLAATNIANDCYHSMFNGCTSLVNVQATLPATTLASACYNGMFAGCSALRTAPALPARTLAVNCYGRMFQETAITTAPELPADTLVNTCYDHMFNGCRNLNYVDVGVTPTWDANCTTNWLYNVAATGTVVCYPVNIPASSSSGIPYGWTRTQKS